MSKQIKAIMEKPVTRRQFLSHMGLILIGIMGFGSVLNMLLDHEKHLQLPSDKKASKGFGAGKFGI